MSEWEAGQARGAETVLEQLQRAVKDHERILQQQQVLIRRLREELEGVRRDDG